jgi:hypothetical protein
LIKSELWIRDEKLLMESRTLLMNVSLVSKLFKFFSRRKVLVLANKSLK